MRFESDPPTEETLNTIRAAMRRQTESHVPWENYTDVIFIARNDDDDSITAAAFGETGRGWLHISLVWVHENSPRQGLGSQLVAKLETEAIVRGCHAASLDTFSYQARPF